MKVRREADIISKNRRYFTEQGIKYIWTKNAEPSIIMGIDIGKGDK